MYDIYGENKMVENPGIDPGTSHMLSERSTIWANSPYIYMASNNVYLEKEYQIGEGVKKLIGSGGIRTHASEETGA